MRRLIVSPHADDESLGCGGLLAKYPNECTVVVLAQTDGVRAKEFAQARRILGYENTHPGLGLPDGYVGADMRVLTSYLDAILREVRPDEMYLPYPSLHQDHIAAYEAGMRASRLSMGSEHWFPPSVYVYDVSAYDLNLYTTDLKWNTFLSLDEEHIAKKVAAIRAYSSQMVVGPHPVNGIKEIAQALGASRQVAYAEQYACVRQVRQ